MYLRHLSAECRSILSADMATDTQSTDALSTHDPKRGRVVGAS